MRSTHLIAAACAAALLGAVTGASMGTGPLERGTNAWDYIQRPGLADDQAVRLSEPEALPNHYPIVTPQGRFEVAELRDRGLYRNRRFGSASWVDYPEPAYDLAPADYRYLPDDDYAPAPDRSATRLTATARAMSEPLASQDKPLEIAAEEADAIAPPPLAEPAALVEGRPDVPVELAAR